MIKGLNYTLKVTSRKAGSVRTDQARLGAVGEALGKPPKPQLTPDFAGRT